MGKIYAVRVGRKLGIYGNYDDCMQQVNHFKGAEYKSFKTEEEAEAYLGDGYTSHGTNIFNQYTNSDASAYIDGYIDQTKDTLVSCIYFVNDD